MTATLVLELALAAMQHAAELTALLKTATAEGRDVTQAEVDALRSKATAAVDALEAQIRASTA